MPRIHTELMFAAGLVLAVVTVLRPQPRLEALPYVLFLMGQRMTVPLDRRSRERCDEESILPVDMPEPPGSL